MKIAQQVYNSIPETVKTNLVDEVGKVPTKLGKTTYKTLVKKKIIEPNRSDKSGKEVDREVIPNNLVKIDQGLKFNIPEMKEPFDVAKKIYGIDKNKLHEGIKEMKEIQANSRGKSFVQGHREQKNLYLTKGNDGHKL